MHRRSLSIAGIVTIGLVAAATLLFSTLGVYIYYRSDTLRSEEFRLRRTILADQLAASLGLPLWNFDQEQIGKMIEGVAPYVDVQTVLVRSSGTPAKLYARTRDGNWQLKITNGPLATEGLLLEKRGIVIADETIGQVQIYYTHRFFAAGMRHVLNIIVGVILLADLILIVALYLLLWRTVLKPLAEIERYAVAVSSNDPAAESLPTSRYLGELETVRGAIKKMVRLLAGRYADLQKSEARYRQLAETLRESEEKFSIAFRASPDPIIISDFDTGRILDANDGFLRTYACTRAEAIGHTTLELGLFASPVDRQRVIDGLRTQGSLRNFKMPGRTLDGASITILLSAELIKLAGRSCLLTVVHDITDQERAEAALRESEEKFSRAFRAGPDAMAITEMSTGCYQEVNDGFERLFGYSRAEAIGRTSVELKLWPDARSRDLFLEVLQKQGAVRDLELTSVNRRGLPITCQLSAECMDLGGKRCVVTVIHDITDRKHAETEHARAVERERRAREEFTRRLLASQEAERRRIAGELHDSLGQNLLLIKNRAQLALVQKNFPAELAQQLDGITTLATEAIAEVRQISHDLRPYQLDQLGLTRALQAIIDNAAQSTAIEFRGKLDPVDDLFSTDAATEIYRIVQEGLNNILKHSGARVVRIDLERDVQQVRLWIEDDGRGFELRTAVGDGVPAGFGLQSIAERVGILGGAIVINSKPGGGTRVEVTIPMPARP